jgi:hypothetical protein
MVFDPYAAPRVLYDKAKAPTHVVTDEDRDRLQSYSLYEDIYWNVPNTFRIKQRGSDANPIYLPSARGIIEACNRFLAVDFGYLVSAETDEVRNQILALVNKIFKREEFFTKFNSQKRYGLIRADSFWHIVADPLKGEEGSGERISIHEVDPAHVFPIWDKDNIDRKVGYHLVDVIIDPDDENKTKTLARRQTYRRQDDGTITSELLHFEPDKWDDRNLKPADIKRIPKSFDKELFTLPEEITALPVYQVTNNRIPGKVFGISEIMGVETVFGAVNQSVSDLELSLAMGGLGVYWTTSGPPRDAAGNVVRWQIGPAMMLELAKESQIGRLPGIQSADPPIDHMNFIMGQAQFGLGVPDIAAGKVDVEVAESGISLFLQMSPLLAKNSEKEGSMVEKYDQMFHDLIKMWLPAFEGVNPESIASMVSVVGDPMPKNRKAQIDEIIALATCTPPLLSNEEARRELVKLGYGDLENDHGEVSSDPIITQERLLAQARDPFAQRLNEELGETGAGSSDNARGNGQVIVR